MSRLPHPGMMVTITIAWILVGFLLAPVLVTIPLSLTPERFLTFPVDEISFRHYAALATDGVWLRSIGDSLIAAVGATIISTIIGTAAAIGVWQMEGRAAKIIGFLPILPLVVPAIVSALALGRAWAELGLFDTYLAVMVTHAIVGMPFVFMTVSAALAGFDRNIANAARSLGYGPYRTTLHVIVPNVKIGVASGALFAFMTSWDEVVLTSFITSRNVITLPKKIFGDIQTNISPEIAAMSTVLVALTLVGAVIYFVKVMLKPTKGPGF